MICVIAIGLILMVIIGWLIYEAKNAPTVDSELTYTRAILVDDIEEDKIKVL
jgi:hypothetical protein